MISIIILSFLFIFNPNLTSKINKQIENDLIKNKKELKTSNPGDDCFKFTYGLWLEHNYWELDPHNAWGGSDSIVIDQVCEGLFRYNLSDPNMAIVPNLANGTGTWSSDNLNYTVLLLNNVTFHDGTKFNATAVKVSFDRLAYFMNSTGKMTPQNITTINRLYRWKDYTPFINRTEIINETAIKFVLNRPFTGLPGLLCSPGSYILSPASTSQNHYINGSAMDDLVGTGPFIYDRYIPNDEVRFHAYENYTRGKAQIELLRFSIIPTSNQNQTLIDGQVDLIGAPSHDMLNSLEVDPNINVIKNWSTAFYYLGMNNKLLNKTWRQAISYAINYSYIIDNIYTTPSKRVKSPIADSIIYSNNTNQVADLNITKARELMQSMGFGVGLNTTYPGSNESQWTSSTFASDEFGSPIDLNLFNFSGTPHQVNQLLNNLLINNLSKIGIDLTETDRDWDPFLDTGSNNPDNLGLWFVGWAPDFNDPYTVINELYSNFSIGTNNYGQVNDTTLQNLINNAMNETDPAVRKIIYNNIQKYIVEDLMPMAFLWTPRVYDAYYDYVEGFKSNPWDKMIFYEVSQNSTLFPGNININGDQEWDILKTMGKCSGFGNSSDPYIIEDLVIDGQGRSRSCILIENSSRNFIIYNCSLINSAGAGIELINANNSIIAGNNVSDNNYGVLIINSNSSLIVNNGFFTNNINALDNGTNNFWNNASIGNYWDDYDGIDVNEDGIGDTPYYIPGSAGSQDNFPIWDDGFDTYIVFYVSGDYSIRDGSIEVDLNVILNITIEYMPYLTNNHISSASVELQSSTFSYSFIEDLTFKQYTLQLDTADLGVATHNFVISAQKEPNATTSYKTVLYPIQIIVNEEPESYPIPPLVIDDTGEGDYTWDDAVEQGWCTGSGTEEDPYIIESLEIDGQDSSSCLSIRNSSVYFIIQNCIFFNAGGGINEAGLKLEHVSNAILRNINCSDNNANGFLLYDCQNITVSDSTMNDNDFAGIYLSQSSFNFILNNAETISRNFWGVYLLFSNNNTIGGNFIGYNQFGLFFNNSDFNSILDNIFKANDQAIYVDEDSEGNHIEGNTIITKGKFPLFIVIVSVAVGIVGVAGLSSAIILRKKVFSPKRGKEVKVFGKKKSKIQNKLEERLSFIDHLIKERKIKEAIKNLNEVRELSKTYSLIDITEACEKSIIYCNNIYLEIISRIKKTVLNLGTKFSRLEIIDISDKSGIEDEDLIISVFQDMIHQNEIFGDYFASSKAIAFEQQRNIDQIDDLIQAYNKWKEINIGKGASKLSKVDLDIPEIEALSKLRPDELKEFNIFLSYSTRDSEYFDMPRIVKRLEDYPDIDRVLFWEADSKQNIVEFMDETLQKCNVFILFCSENSVKSLAVKDEWQAAFQRRKKELLKLIPVYIKEEHIPPILGHLLNVKFEKDNFDAFIEKLHQEIQR